MEWRYERRRASLGLMANNSTPESLVGLSIGNMVHKNLAMLFKWIWRLLDIPFQLWCKVFRTKYKYSIPFTIADLTVPPKGGPWKHISAAVLKHPGAKTMAINGVRKALSNAGDCYFWHDIWLGSTSQNYYFQGSTFLQYPQMQMWIRMNF